MRISTLNLVFTVPPSSVARVDSPWSTGLRVEVHDALGRLRTSDSRTQIRLGPRPGSPGLAGTLTRTLQRGVAIFDDLRFLATGDAVVDFVDVTNGQPIDTSRISGVSVTVVDRPWSFDAAERRLVHAGGPTGPADLEVRDVNGDALPDLLHRGVWLQQAGTGEFARSAALSDLTGDLIDLDSDGFADRVVWDGPGSPTVGIAYQDPLRPGSFTNLVTSTMNASRLGFGDLDADGRFEVAALIDGGPGVNCSVAIYGQSVAVPGQLVLRTSFDIPNLFYCVGVRIGIADTDADPVRDLLVVLKPWGHSEQSFLFRVRQDPQAPGSFLVPELIDVHFPPLVPIDYFVAHDITGDGLPDAVYISGGVAYYHDAFGPRSTWMPANRLRFTDLDGDGNLDAAVQAAGMVQLLRFDPTYAGPPAMRPVAAYPCDDNTSVALADMNGDGRSDLVSAVHEGPGNYQFVGIAHQEPAPAASVGAFPWPVPIEGQYLGTDPVLLHIADLDRDGEGDYVLSSGTRPESAVRLVHNQPGPSVGFDTQQILPVNNPDGVAIGDLDADGWPDLVMSNFNISGQTITSRDVHVFRNNPTAVAFADRFVRMALLEGAGTTHVRLVDIDGDGRLDIACVTDSQFYWYRQGPAWTFAMSTPQTLVVGNQVNMAFGDLDHDGRLELVNAAADTVHVVRQARAAGVFDVSTTIPLDPVSTAGGLAIGDVDVDGDLDIVVADRGTHGFSLIRTFRRSSGPPTLVRESYTLLVPSDQIFLLDVDGDGPLEVVTFARDNDVATVSSFGAPGELRETRHFVAGGRRLQAVFGDLDGDRITDFSLWPRAVLGR